jgi:squalene-hopene/tetraprenyl-beta-curcumene cyclase
MDETEINGGRARGKRFVRLAQIAAVCGIALASTACTQSKPAHTDNTWDPKAAAGYLDRRMEWWIGWKNSARDHGTFCVSCHTAVPYALARGALRLTLAEPATPAPERQLIDDVRRRVRLWHKTNPFYGDDYDGRGKSAESRGTEAVLSALMLAWDDAPAGRLNADTLSAFDHMWVEQHASGESSGAWSWLDFGLAPWEAADAQYYGAALAAMAVGAAPENYRARPEIQAHLQQLRDYLAREYAAQSLHHRLVLLWASTKLPGIVESAERESLVAEVLRAQNPDGGWSLSALLTKPGKRDTLLSHPESDGYATGLVTLVLGQTAMSGAAPQVQRGLVWLVQNQVGHSGSWIWGNEGFWEARSLNKWRNPWSNVGRFMSDAATAYAVLALTEPSRAESRVASVAK